MNSAYKTVTINSKNYYVHRLVWELVYGPIPAGFIVHHKDEDPGNNHPDNLELMMQSDHAALHVRKRGGSEERLGRKPAKPKYQPRPATHYKCAVCGIDAIARKSNAMYCSKTCNMRAAHARRRSA